MVGKLLERIASTSARAAFDAGNTNRDTFLNRAFSYNGGVLRNESSRQKHFLIKIYLLNFGRLPTLGLTISVNEGRVVVCSIFSFMVSLRSPCIHMFMLEIRARHISSHIRADWILVCL